MDWLEWAVIGMGVVALVGYLAALAATFGAWTDGK